MSKELTTKTKVNAQAIEQVLMEGDLARLNSEQRVQYVNSVCESLGLNPLTRPFEFLKFQGKVVLYARKDATEQLRKTHKVSVRILSRERVEDLLIVTAQATTPDGRQDECIGALAIGNLKGEALAHAVMKCETKAKRRVTLSICGLGMLDETEIEGGGNGPANIEAKPWEKAPEQVTSGDFAKGSDPVLDADFKDAPKPEPMPWEDAKAPEPEVEHELASFEIPGGPHKGLKLGDKPDAFWSIHKKELEDNLERIPADRQSVAKDTIMAIKLYLERA